MAMYKFTLSDRCRQRGVLPDVISLEMYNRFEVLFNKECDGAILNERIQVRLDDNAVRFFYYIGEINEIRIEDNFKEIASISLAEIKETDHDILHFNEQVKVNCQVVVEDMNKRSEGGCAYNAIDNYCDYLVGEGGKRRLFSFPFVKQLEKFENKNKRICIEKKCTEKTIKERVEYLFIVLMQCCFLYFIHDIEDGESDFVQSPHYKKVLGRLHKSMVYQLLRAKLKYTLYLYEDTAPQNKEDYSFITRGFADLLMDSNINQVIAINNYYDKRQDNKTDVQMWFYDPEDELESILEKNRQQKLLNDSFFLDERLVLDIRDFFYSKHAIEQTMTSNTSKMLFFYVQTLMAVTSLAILSSSILMKFAHVILHIVFPVCILIYLFTVRIFYIVWKEERETNNGYRIHETQNKTIKQRYESIHKCMHELKSEYGKEWWFVGPHIILFAFAVFSLLDSSYSIISTVFYFLFVVCIIIWLIQCGRYSDPGEIKGDSSMLYPFFPRILVAELAAWLVIGVSEDLVKSLLWMSKSSIVAFEIVALLGVLALVSVILSVGIKRHSPYKRRVSTYPKVIPILNQSLFFALLIGIVVQFVFCENLLKNNDVMSSVVFNNYFRKANNYCSQLENLDKSITQYEHLYYVDSAALICSKPSLTDSSVVFTSSLMDALNIYSNPKEFAGLHNGLVESYNKILSRMEPDSICPLFLQKEMLTIDNNMPDSILSRQIDSIRKKNLNILIPLSGTLRDEISVVQSSLLKFNNNDTLINWVTFKETRIAVNTGSVYLDNITEASKKDFICYQTTILDKRFFPVLLFFHTLIVLILAFVTQLFISEKSVTDPL